MTPAVSTSHTSILSFMSKWFFISNIVSLYIFAFQLCLCRKRLTWSNGCLQVILHALDVFSVVFSTAFVEVKNRHSHGCRIVCFGYVHVLPEVLKSSKQHIKKQLKWCTFFRLSNSSFSAIKSITVLIRNQTQYRWRVTTLIISCLHLIDPL